MKKTIIISLIALATTVQAQIKVFPSSLHSYGSTTSPASTVNHQFTGSLAVSESGSTASGCALIKANGTTNVSSVSRPDYTWLGDATTGIFHPGANTIGFTTGGSEKLRINTNGQILFNNSPNSWAPDIAWTGDISTGIFHPASNTIAFTIAGTERYRFNSSFQILSNNSSWSQATPDYSWSGDANTGMYHPASDILGFVTGGTERMRVSNNGNIIVGGTTDDNNQRCIITGINDKMALNLYATHSSNYQYAFMCNVNNSTSKAIAVMYNGTEKFTVRGNGDVFTTTGYYISDRSLKDNIDTIPDALNKILQLQGVTYNFKAETLKSNAMVGTVLPTGTPKKEIGLIAQDVELILPEVVGTMDNGLKAVAYQNLVPLLIEAIKAQNKTITSLQNDVNNCCTKNSGGKTNRTINSNDDGSSSNEDSKSYMKQNKPNPFNKETIIEYNIVQEGTASVIIFDMNGKLLKTIPVKIPGKGNITISANDFNPGMYYYSLIVNDNEMDTKKMILTE